MESNQIKKGAKLLLIVAMIFYFFPFSLVSCSGQSVEVSGMELMTTISMNKDREFDEEDTPNYYLIVAFTLALTGLFCAWNASKYDKKMLAAGCCSMGGALFLLLFRSTFWEFYELTGYKGSITVEFCWGWTMSLLSYLSAGGLSFWVFYLDNNNTTYPKKYVAKSPPQVPQSEASIPESELKPPVIQENISHSSPKTMLLTDNGVDAFTPSSSSPIVVIHRNEGEKKYSISIDHYPYIVGRNKDSCDLQVDDPKASRVHAQFVLHNVDVYIEDLGSSNGTWVNDERIQHQTQILSGDDIAIGTTHFMVEVREA